MNKFNKPGKFNDRKSGGIKAGGRRGPKDFSDRGFNRRGGDDSRRPAMHRAVCGECGDDCEVPFKPTGARPVLCSACFGNQSRGDTRSNRSNDSRNKRPRFEDRQMHDAICATCGDNCQVPFRPTSNKPIYCDNCFGGNDGQGQVNDNSGEVIQEIKVLSTKIDDLIKVLASNTPAKKTEKVKVAKKVETKKAKPKSKAKPAKKKDPAKKKK